MKRILFLIFMGISVLIIYNLIVSIHSLWQKRSLVTDIQKELEKKKEENIELKKKLSEAEKKEFIEKEARNKLLMVKEGESSVVIDEKLLKSVGESNLKRVKDKRNNVQKWLDLFFSD